MPAGANVPVAPNQAYKGRGWEGWGHWLGTGNTRTKPTLPFDEARTAALLRRSPSG